MIIINTPNLMIKIGITGQSGFVGAHLFNTLALYGRLFKRVEFQDSFFDDNKKLKEFVTECDVVVHLAAMNRNNDPNVIYETNVKLVSQLIAACEEASSKPHILFSSSIQETNNSSYGISKKEGRKLFEQWALRNKSKFTGLIIPNVFGPFGSPYYNSVVATFCHQLTHGEEPIVERDGEVKLIYVGELIEIIIAHILEIYRIKDLRSVINQIEIPYTEAVKVSELLRKLRGFKEYYLGKGIIPSLIDSFDRNLFNTFLCYIDYRNFFPFPLKVNVDNRGSFVEVVKVNSGGQISFSTTAPGVTRGNHFHTRKVERFAVIKGKARIELRKIDTSEILTFDLDGQQPSFVDIPIWYTHNIRNMGDDILFTIFWISEEYNNDAPDTFPEVVSGVRPGLIKVE